MEYKEIIRQCFPEIWKGQYLICKNFDMELIYYADDDEFLIWNGMECTNVTDTMKKNLNQGVNVMEYVEMLTRSEMTNNYGDTTFQK